MKFRHHHDQLQYFCRERGWRSLSSSVKVLARTRSPDRKSGFSACIEIINMDKQTIRMIVPARKIMGGTNYQLRDELFDTGFWLEPEQTAWNMVQRYLREELKAAETAFCVTRTGWHDKVFVTPEKSFGRSDESYYFSGGMADSLCLAEGSLAEWQSEVGSLLVGNPLLIFSVGVALAAPLLKPVGMESAAFHVMGPSSSGKSVTSFVAASVYADKSYIKSWKTTANGIEAVASEHHDMLLVLDELGLCSAEEASSAAYQIVNGCGKLRATETGGLANIANWRTLTLSNGEIGLTELMESAGYQVKAGQLIRVIEIPAEERFGCFADLHRFSSPSQFAEHLEKQTQKYFGTLFTTWMTLISDKPDLEVVLQREIETLRQHWSKSNYSGQVHRVLKRFVLVGVALSVASRNQLVPWSEEESLYSVYSVFSRWLSHRGHQHNQETYEVLSALKQAISHWENKLPEFCTSRSSKFGYWRQDGDEIQWLIHKQEFVKQLRLRRQYKSQLSPLIHKGWFETNEDRRGTLRIIEKKNGTEFDHRFFVFWPEKILSELKEMGIDE
ncbi:DUF927 domain-containing protein [Vibrio vulnificus]|uniref:DUF927 domain-containing protein n=1 Tax=Vibrio vulnificus TaxID=672 RepID=UPI00307E9067